LIYDFETCSHEDEVLRCLASHASEITGVAGTTAQLVEANYRCLQLVYARGFDRQFIRYFHRVDRYGGSVCSRSMLKRAPFIVEDVMLDTDCSPHWRVFEAANVRTVLSMPLITSGGAFYGIVSTLDAQRHVPIPSDVKELQRAAKLAANRIARIRSSRAKRSPA